MLSGDQMFIPANTEAKPPLNSLKTLKKAHEEGTYPANVNVLELQRLEHILSSPRLETKEKRMFSCLRMDWEYVLSELEELIDKNTKIYEQIQFVKKDIRRAPIVAAENGFSDLIALFLKHDFDIETSFKPLNRTILLHAADNGQITLVYFLLTQGADIETIDVNRCSCLHIAASNGDIPLMELLLSQSEMLNPRDLAWRTPLHYAIQYTHVDILKLLVSHGADVHVKDFENKTLLHAAATRKNGKIFDILLEKGLDIDAQDDCLRTPLHLAVLSSCLESTRLLLERGANKNLKTSKGETPLYCAIKRNYVNIVCLLLDYGVDTRDKSLYDDGTSILHWAASIGDINIFSRLMERQENLHVVDAEGLKPVDIACNAGHYKLVEYIANYMTHELADITNWKDEEIILGSEL